jgi:hypothetical protein
MQTLTQKALVAGAPIQAKPRVGSKSMRTPVVVRAQKEESVSMIRYLRLLACAPCC